MQKLTIYEIKLKTGRVVILWASPFFRKLQCNDFLPKPNLMVLRCIKYVNFFGQGEMHFAVSKSFFMLPENLDFKNQFSLRLLLYCHFFDKIAFLAILLPSEFY